MSGTATIELSPELKARLLERGDGEQSPDAIVAEMLRDIDYLERVNELATDGYWPANEYY